jgi:putative phosphoesterase
LSEKAVDVKILAFADLHGNFDALQALQAVESKPDAVLFLGDIVGYGPEPQPCLAWIRSNATHAVRGNHDEATARDVPSRCPPDLADLAEATKAYTRRMLNESDLDYLGSLPLEETVSLGGVRFYLTHAAPSDNLAKPLPLTDHKESELAAEIAHLEADVVFLGHTHVPEIRQVGGTVLVNPGSLGQPRHGTASPTYAVWEDGELQIRHIHYDLSPVLRKLSLLPLDPDHIARLQAIIQTALV